MDLENDCLGAGGVRIRDRREDIVVRTSCPDALGFPMRCVFLGWTQQVY